MDAEQLTNIWNQREIPVILRRTGKGELLRLRLPYAETNRAWLQNDRRIVPAWIAGKRCWEIPKAWFNDFVERALATFGAVYVIQPYREQEKCSPPASTQSDTSVSAPAWDETTEPATTGAGSRYPRRSPRDGVIRCSPADS